MRLNDKVAVITGAASGIGYAAAKRFVEEGAKVVAVDWHEAKLQESLGTIDGAIIPFVANVAEEASAGMVDRAVQEFGRIDILVNNAGIMDLFQSVADVNNETWRRVMAVNVDGPMFAMRRAVPIMLSQGGGAIVNVASVAGLGGGSAGAAYTASKHALIGLTKSTAFQYAKLGLRCNAIASGGVETNIMQSIDAAKIDQAAMGRLAAYHATNPGTLSPDDLANVLLFLVSDEAKHVNGAIVPVDMGWRAA